MTEASALGRCECRPGDFSLLHTALFSVSRISRCILPSWAHAQFTEEKGAWEVDGIGQGSAAGCSLGLGLQAPALRCKCLYSWGLLLITASSQLFSSFLRGSWGRAGGEGLPQPYKQPLSPEPVPLSPLLLLHLLLCV